MCKIGIKLKPGVNYHGLIARNSQGCIFYPHNCAIDNDGTIMPSLNFRSLNDFRERFKLATELTTDPDPPLFECEFFGDRARLRERILYLNSLFNLPGFAAERQQAA